MAGASKRTSICLAAVALVFIVVIIILCVIPNPCRDRDPRPECRDFGTSGKHKGSTTLTTKTTESTSLSPTPPTTPSTDGSTASVSSTVGDDTTSISTSSELTTSSSTSMSTTVSIESSHTTSTMSETSASTTEALDSTSTTTDMPESSTENTTEIMYSSFDTTTTDMPETTTVTSYVSETYNATTDVTQNITTLYEATISTTASVEMTNATTPEPTVSTTAWVEMTNATTPEPTVSTTASVEMTNATTPEPTVSTTASVEMTNATTTEPTISTTVSIELTNATTPEPTVSTTVSDEMTNATTSETTTTTDVPETTNSTEAATYSTTTVATTTTKLPVYRNENVCQSKMCRAVAARMLDVMDHGNVDPCEDFYQFSCGGVINDNFLKPEDAQLPANIIIKESLAKADRNDPALKELLVFYDSCRNYSNHPMEDRLQKAQDVFNSLGYQFKPKVNASQDEKFSLSIALAKMMKMHFTPIFEIMIDVSEDNPKYTFDFKMTLPAFQSPFSLDLAKDVCLTNYRKANEEAKLSGEIFNINTNYDEFVSCKNEGDGLSARLDKMEEAVGVLNLTGHISTTASKEEMLSSTRTELNFLLNDISKVMPSPPEIRQSSLNKKYEIYTLEQLDDGSIFPYSPIVFSEFFKELLGQPVNAKKTTIQLYFKDIFDDIFGILQDVEDPQFMQNMFLLLWSERVYSDLIKPVGPAPGSEDYCLNAVTNFMDDSVSYLYLKNLPKREALRKKMTTLIKRHIDEAKAQVAEQTSSAKEDIMDKLEELTGEIPNLRDMEGALLDNKQVSVTENDFVENYASLMKHYRERLYKLYDNEEPYSAMSMWSLIQFPYKANGVTSYGLNKFLIPLAVMAPPFYYGEDVPDYINYAGVGHMIAHELMHGFDSTGMEYNYEGRNPMPKVNRLVYLSECIGQELIPNFTSKSSSGLNSTFALHRDLFLNELLADSAATKLAWDTFIEDFISQGMPEKTTPFVPEITLPPARRRRREAEGYYAVEGLRNRNKRVAPLLDTALPLPKQQRLPYMTRFTPMQLYYIKTAQNQCGATDEIDIIGVMENEHLPPRLRINLMLRNDPMFARAFECRPPSYMAPREQCQFTPTGTKPSKRAVWEDPLFELLRIN